MATSLKAWVLLHFVCLSITAGEKKVADESAESMVSALMDGFDTSQDGKISLQELMDHIGDNAEVHAAYEGWQTGFSQADADQDGHLTAEELAFLLQSATEQQKDQLVQESEESIAALLVDGFDADKDGSISLKELFDHVGDDTTVRKSFQGWQSGFTEADVDSDGRLSVKELASLLKHVSFQGQSKLIDESEMSIAASIMDGFDTNRDRMISLQELEGHVGDREQIHAAFAGWQEGFSQADVNKDGHLTEKELASLISHVSRQDQHKMVEHSEETIAEQVMAGLDTNRDQKISLEELKHHMGEGAEMHAAFAGWDEGFLQADADQDAELDMHELTSLLSQVSRLDQRKLVVDSEVETADSIMDGFDTDKDGKLGLQELLDHVGDIGDIHAAFAGWQEGFKQADFDKDGYLGHDELASLMGRVSNQDQKKLVHASEASVAISLMNGFDMDGDGKISLQELLAHVGDDEHLHAAFSGWKLGFREADADRDGHLSAEELTSLLGHVSRENQHHMVHKNDESIAHKIMDGFDSNKDGKLSYEELQEHLHNNKKMTATFQGWEDGFSQADGNNDGHLSIGEITTFLSHTSNQQQHEMVREVAAAAGSVMARFDADKDGQISMQELLDHVGVHAVENSPEAKAHTADWKSGFVEADVNGDEHLSHEELVSLLENVYKHKKLQHDEM